MKKFLFTFFVYFALLPVFSQVQKIFFVDDANGVDFVTVNFCVNDEAKIDKVIVIEEKSTYTNKYVIEQLREYLLAIQYYPDSKLKNNCYDSTFSFVNLKYKNSNFSKNECSIDKDFLKGRYSYKNPAFKKTIIKRGKRLQREKGNNNKQIYYIKWETACSYKLIYKRMTEKRLKKLIGEEIYVEILDVLPNDSYVYKSTVSYDDRVVYGVIKKEK